MAGAVLGADPDLAVGAARSCGAAADAIVGIIDRATTNAGELARNMRASLEIGTGADRRP
jgi:hypothetical protein